MVRGPGRPGAASLATELARGKRGRPGRDSHASEPGLVPAQLMPDETKTIELWPCGYQAPCKVKNCKSKATAIARSVDAQGRPIRQYELCAVHAEQVAERERGRGR